MKIATWNIERLRYKNNLSEIIDRCKQVNADILVLTETDSRINLDYKSCISTTPPKEGNYYKLTETRVSIYTNYQIVKQYATFDEHTAVCVELKTEVGNLIVYGTVIGIYGNRDNSFIPDLLCQIRDIERLVKENNICFVGDFNCSFADNYYFTKDGRAALEDVFLRNNITLLTREKPECIDHIAISSMIAADLSRETTEWNCDKKLSDHKGIAVELR